MAGQAALIFVLFDGIENSVFAGQVLAPLVALKRQHPEREIVIVSFEGKKTVHSKSAHPELVEGYERISIIILARLPFFGKASLWPAIRELRKVLTAYSEYELIARGPLAGWVAGQARDYKKCQSFKIQARGLLAAEYAYAHSFNKRLFKKLFHHWREQSLARIEKDAYQQSDCTIESVSDSLSSYLMSTYSVAPDKFCLAERDIPLQIPFAEKDKWRNEVRNELAIESQAKVYCYNGSAKPWQCPELAVNYFKDALGQHAHSFLLVLTQETQPFLQLLSKNNIPADRYCVMTVSHHEIYKYLSACDVGLIFRKPSIINWVSRPTKVLEYQAVGLPIAHNNTIGLLSPSHHFPLA